jgi:5-(carboxyamino)imidazole ribonucleotide synthase
MVNLIGQDIETIKQDAECQRLIGLPRAFLHDYGKRETRPRRKMGHVTFLAQDRDIARERAEQFHRRLLHAIGHRDGL